MRACTQYTLVALIVSLGSIWSLATYSNWALTAAYVRELSAFQAAEVSRAVDDLDASIHSRMATLTLVAEGIDAGLLADPASLQDYFDNRHELLATFRDGVFVARPDGTGIAGYPNDGRVGLYYMDDVYIAAALTQGKTGVGEPELDEGRTDLSFTMTVPIRNAQREVIGALSGLANLPTHHSFKHRNVQAGSTGDSFLHGRQHQRIVPASDKSGLMTALLVADDNLVLDSILNGDEAIQHFTNLSGDAVMVSAKRIPAADWLVLVSWPTKDAVAPIQDTVQRTQWVAGVLSLLLLMLAGLMLRHQWSLVLSRSQLGRATDKLKLAHDEMAYNREEMQEQKTELGLANVELAYQNSEKGKRAKELALANLELAYRNSEKIKRAEDLVVANVERKKEREEADRLSRLSFYDPLTNLPNRRLLSDRMTQMLASSRRTGRHLALMVLDLDNFKSLNDLHGHLMGDLLLVEVGQRLMACVREVDTVARFGGDEFVLVMGDLDLDNAKSTAQAREVAEKVRHSLAMPYRLKESPTQSEDRVIEHHCSVSIGVLVLVDHGLNHDEALKLADAAMYQAKQAGRNMIRIHEASI